MLLTWKIIEQFCQEYGCELRETEGWKCGLGQILDIEQKEIMEVLPYILSAYMYNFGEESQGGRKKWLHTGFVKGFYERQKELERQKKLDIPKEEIEKVLFGFPSSKDVRLVEKGIGKLLIDNFDIDNYRNVAILKTYSENFVFPKIAYVEEGTRMSKDSSELVPNFNVKMIVPKEIEANVKIEFRTAYCMTNFDEFTEISVPCYTGKREYNRDVFESIFLTWYFVIHSMEKQLQTLESGGKLNPIRCRFLIEQVLQDDKRILQIKQDISKESSKNNLLKLG